MSVSPIRYVQVAILIKFHVRLLLLASVNETGSGLVIFWFSIKLINVDKHGTLNAYILAIEEIELRHITEIGCSICIWDIFEIQSPTFKFNQI